MSVLGWLQVAFDIAAILTLTFHRHPIGWRRR